MLDKLLNTNFKSESQEGFEEFLAAQKMNLIVRKIAATMTISEILSQEGDEYTLTIISSFKNHKMKFRLNEPFVDHGVDGRDMTTVFFIQGDTLVATQDNIKDGDVPCRYERRLLPDGKLEIKHISVPTNTVCTRICVPTAK